VDRYLKRFLDDRAEDVMQETFLRLFTILETDEEVALKNETLKELVYVVAARAAIDDLRSHCRRSKLHNEFALFPLDAPRPADTEAMVAEIRREIHRALLKLPRADRRTALLYFVGGYSIKDVALRTRMTVAGATSLISRSRQLLITHLERYWKGAGYDVRTDAGGAGGSADGSVSRLHRSTDAAD
jgi:RNA polymerase sigma factor (sigma-70 family)